ARRRRTGGGCDPVRNMEQRHVLSAGRARTGLGVTAKQPAWVAGSGRFQLSSTEPFSPNWVIGRFLQLGRPGRRGFGGAADPVEAAALREATRGDHDLNPGMTPPSAALRPAAVLVPLIDRAEGMSVLLTQRTPHLSAHAGLISFPGGRIEESDADAMEAALRETEEEVGLTRDHVRVIGRLDTYVTGTGFEITPVVGLVR